MTPKAVVAEPAPEPMLEREAQTHRTVDRVTRILEEVVYTPGMTLAELARALDAPKSSAYGFIRGLVAKGWLYEEKKRFYLGPAVYGLTLASGHIRAGLVTHEDLAALHEKTGISVFVGVQAADHLIYVAEAGADPVIGFDARSNIRRSILATAGGKALLAARPDAEREAFLRRHRVPDADLVTQFLNEFAQIRRTRIARNVRHGGTRFAIATALRDQSGRAVASVTLVGAAAQVEPREQELSAILLSLVERWQRRMVAAREPI